MKYILLFSVILIIISLTQQELNIIQTKLFSNVHNQFTHSLYKKTYWKINRMKIQYFAERGSAEIINTIGMDIDNVSSVVDQITQFSISSILQIIGGVVGLSLLDWKLAILIEAIIPLKFIIVSYCANKKREVFEQWIEDKRDVYKRQPYNRISVPYSPASQGLSAGYFPAPSLTEKHFEMFHRVSVALYSLLLLNGSFRCV